MPDPDMRMVYWEGPKGDLYVVLIRQINRSDIGWLTQLDVQVISAHPVYWNQRFTPSPFPPRWPAQHTDAAIEEEAKKIGELIGEVMTDKLLKALEELKTSRPTPTQPHPASVQVRPGATSITSQQLGHPRDPRP
jgi:hypothetical protein